MRPRVADPLHRRLRTAGRIVPEMQVRLFDGDLDVTESGRGQPACRGPALSLGYLNGTDHDKLFTKDGWMRMGDICELDDEGYLTLTGRTSDFILRGGKNISAVQVEEAVATHPAVAVAAAVAMPDPVFGERVCVFVELKQAGVLDLPDARRTPASAGCFQGTAARKTRSPRRAAAILGRQDRQRPTSRGHPIDRGGLTFNRAVVMTTNEVRRGGLEVWAPSKVPPIGVDLTDEQAMAVAFRHLAGIGFAENMAGHITWQPDGQLDMYVNPWGLWWQELTASDICVVDEDARVVGGRWDVTPAIHLHTELHRLRPDARVVIHNHPYYVSLIAALGTLPELVHQTGSLFLDDMYLVENYDGEIDAPWRASELAEQVGSANLVILANHGVIATGRNLAEAVYRAVSIERVCRLAYDVMLTGRTPSRMNRGDMVGMQQSLIERAADVYWAGAARMTIKADPGVLN